MSFFADGSLFYGFTVFFNPIRRTFGWSAAATSVAFSIQRVAMGILSPVVGFLVDRVGPKRLMLFGWSMFGLGFLLTARINSLWALYGSFLIIALGMSFGFFLVMNTTVANWFIKKRSRAMTIISAGMASSGVLVPLLAFLVDEVGWRTSLSIVGITLWAVGLPLSLVMRHRPSQYGLLPDGETTVMPDERAGVSSNEPVREIVEPEIGVPAVGFTAKEALKTRTFWLLAVISFFQQIGMGSVSVHIVPYLVSIDVPTAIAASTVTGMTICSLVGRLGFGFLGDFINKRYLIAIAFALQSIGLFLFSLIAIDKVWLIVLFLITYAPGYGSIIPLRPALQADYFGSKQFGTIAGLMMIMSMFGGISSPIVAGLIFDITGSYRPVWQLFSLIIAPAIFLVLLAKPPNNE